MQAWLYLHCIRYASLTIPALHPVCKPDYTCIASDMQAWLYLHCIRYASLTIPALHPICKPDYTCTTSDIQAWPYLHYIRYTPALHPICKPDYTCTTSDMQAWLYLHYIRHASLTIPALHPVCHPDYTCTASGMQAWLYLHCTRGSRAVHSNACIVILGSDCTPSTHVTSSSRSTKHLMHASIRPVSQLMPWAASTPGVPATTTAASDAVRMTSRS